MEPTEDAITTLLLDLGKTGPQVAKKLHKLGFKGVPGCPWRCPVAHYLLSFFPGADLSVGVPGVWLKDFEVELTKGVAAFLKAFDKGKYKESVKLLEG
jgi:hypothetical protein